MFAAIVDNNSIPVLFWHAYGQKSCTPPLLQHTSISLVQSYPDLPVRGTWLLSLVYKATPSQSLVSGHISCPKYMWAGGWVLIKLRQEEEVLKSYHRCMVSKPRVQTTTDHIITHNFKYTGSLIVKFNAE